MNRLYPNLLTPAECLTLSTEMFSSQGLGKTRHEGDDYVENSEGLYNLAGAVKLVPKIEEKIKQDYGSNIQFENNYTRIYKNRAILNCHTDRPGLDITLSVCVHADDNIEWPIHVSKSQIDGPWNDKYAVNHMTDYYSYVTPVGTGVACLGTKSPHWRNRLICEPHQTIIQAFFHWKYV